MAPSGVAAWDRPPGFFVTGTDTGIGKTTVTTGLLRAIQRTGRRARAMKPIATGAVRGPRGEWEHEDVRRLREASSPPAPRPRAINPFAFEDPVAPHLAAGKTPIRLGPIRQGLAELGRDGALVLVEGIGGWCVPLGPDLDLAELPRALGLPVILVVGLRLGCLNHALLTQAAIRAEGLRLAGWVANAVDPSMKRAEENVAALRERIGAPLLGVVPRLGLPDPEVIGDHLDPARIRGLVGDLAGSRG